MDRTIFLDLKGKELSIYTIERNGKPVLNQGKLTVSVGEGYSFDIEKAVGDMKEAYLSLPLDLLNFRIIELPFFDMKKVMEMLPFELDGLIIGGTEGIVFDAYPLGESNGIFRILVTYIMKDTLRAILSGLKTSGLDPRVVTSLELSHILGCPASGRDITGLLLTPEQITDEERVKTAVKELEKPAINLRRGEFAYTADTEKTRKSLRLTAILAALLLLVFFSDAAMTIISLKKENRSIRDEIRKTYVGIFPDEKKITSELYQLRAHLKEMKDKEGSFIGASPLQGLLELTRLSRPGLSLIEITMDKELIVLKGECPSLSDAQKIKKDLEGFLTDVNISETKPSLQNRILFTITAKGGKA